MGFAYEGARLSVRELTYQLNVLLVYRWRTVCPVKVHAIFTSDLVQAEARAV